MKKVATYYKKQVEFFDNILHSKIFMFFMAIFTIIMFFVIVILHFVKEGKETLPYFQKIDPKILPNAVAVTIITFSIVFILMLLCCKDMAILILPLMLLPITMFYISVEAFQYKKLYIVLAGIIGILLIVKIIKNICNFKVGKFFVPILIISCIVMIGGIGKLPMETYFKFPGIVHYIMLGPMFVIMYIVAYSNFYNTERDSLKTIAYAMLFVAFGLVVIIVLSHIYLFYEYVYQNGGEALIKNGFSAIIKDYKFYMPWKNLTSQLLLLTIPGVFYLYNLSEKHKGLYFAAIAGIIIISISTMARVGVLFGIIIFIIVSAMVLINSSENIKPLYYVVLGSIFIALFLLIFLIDSNLFNYKNILVIKKTEARVFMYKNAFKTFLENPFLGHGLLYDPNIAEYTKDSTIGLYWVHQNILQVLSNFGLIGFLGYSFSTSKVIKYMKKLEKNERVLGLFFLAVYFMLGLFDIVGFMAVPYEFMLVFILAALDGKYKENREIDVSEYIETDLEITQFED